MMAEESVPKDVMAEDMPKDVHNVIVAVDGSEYSEFALQFYIDALHRPDNHVILAHCTEYRSMTPSAVSVMSPLSDASIKVVTEKIKKAEQKADELMKSLAEKMATAKIEASVSRTHGDAGHAIVSLADERNASFIVVGCRGKGKVRRTVTGSVTDYITHHSHVPVIVARHKDHMEHHHGPHFLKSLGKKKSKDHSVESKSSLDKEEPEVKPGTS